MKTPLYRVCQQQPHPSSDAHLVIALGSLQAMADIVAHIEPAISLPANQQHALAQAPEIARLPTSAGSTFMDDDVYMTESGSKLLQINANVLVRALHGNRQARKSLLVQRGDFRSDWTISEKAR